MERSTVKTPKNGPMDRLFLAVQEIVRGTRQVLAEHSKTSPGRVELRNPVIFTGTDMRVTIEAGPSVAMRNVIEGARQNASGEPVAVRGDAALADAMTLLAQYAAEVKDSQSDGKEAWDDLRSARLFDRLVNCVRALDALRAGAPA